MSKFEPIAIVGQSCVLPGALNPEEFWLAILENRNFLSQATAKDWHIDPNLLIHKARDPKSKESVPHNLGAFVRGFDKIFNPELFKFPRNFVQSLDPLFQWVLHGGQEAIKNCSWQKSRKKTGVILGNLCYPTTALNQLAEKVWLDSPDQNLVNWYNRFMGGYPAQLLAQSLELSGPSFCIDAACASSLYAIKIACDLLQEHEIDLAISGGVNAIDGAFLHLGFSVLKALSPTGRSLPFSTQADGLIPAKGAAFVALRRLEDAIANNEPILGIIRGIGLSNDGRTGSLVSPSTQAQELALQKAYEDSGLSPADISYIECHATGTPLGDQSELNCLKKVFKSQSGLHLGSLKANMGHLLTASGAAALLKVLAMFQHKTLAPFPTVPDLVEDLNQAPFQKISHQKQNWQSSGPRRAAINSFGFGGNNAHLIVEEFISSHRADKPHKGTVISPISKKEKIAIVGLGITFGKSSNKDEVFAKLQNQQSHKENNTNKIDSFKIDISKLGFPPNELVSILPQQSLLIPTVLEALQDLVKDPDANTGILVGTGVDPEVCRFKLRLHDQEQRPQLHDLIPALDASKTLGCMPNIPANRFNLMKNWQAASYVIYGEEFSGLHALNLASLALKKREVDCMVVAAVDLSCEPVHREAASHCLRSEKQEPADAAVAIVLKRLSDAERDGDPPYAILSDNELIKPDLILDDLKQKSSQFDTSFGHAHAASGLLHIAIASLFLKNKSDLQSARILSSSFGNTSMTHDLLKSSYDNSKTQKKATPQTKAVWQELNAHYQPLSFAEEDKVQYLEPAPTLAKALDLYYIEHRDHKNSPKPILFNRDQLMTHACGDISQIFGDSFKALDQYELRVRMPEPPLLLTDRIIGLEAELGSMQCGTITTETDLHHDSWFLHHGRILAGPAIEAGQSDLFLISYLGVDFENKGQRIYRLLGCEATFHRDLAYIGETLRFKITIDRHVKSGENRLFFFHYDCFIGDELFLSIRNGQAGFFSREELKDSKGVLWDPKTIKPEGPIKSTKAKVQTMASSYSYEEIYALTQGDPLACFGIEYGRLASHTRTPNIPGDKLFLLGAVPVFEIHGGPWQNGYLKVVREISPDDWFFKGHFTNDPCMPGTLMTEMALQALSFFMIASGYTLERDAFRFIPTIGKNAKLTCRGQVTPQSKHLTLEVFVRELTDAPIASLTADVLVTVDGLKALYANELSVQLISDYLVPPKNSEELSQNKESPITFASFDGIICNSQQMGHVISGLPSLAFGSRFRPFDNGKRMARLPGEPYAFISRISQLDGPYCGMKVGSNLVAEWDIPQTHPLFIADKIPFSVLLEAFLQPCGWLASYIGCPLSSEQELFFRNLDGEIIFHHYNYKAKKICTSTTVKSISKIQNTIIIQFQVSAFYDDEKKPFVEVLTSFGYFTAAALSNQKGLTISDLERNLLLEEGTCEIFPYREKGMLAPKHLQVLDVVRKLSINGGSYNLGFISAQKNVSPQDWYFRSHFFQDPVMPGSLGLEAILQTLGLFSLRTKNPSASEDYLIVPLHKKFSWKYRGQVLVSNKKMTVLVNIKNNSDSISADAALFADAIKIYEAQDIPISYLS